MFTWGGAIIVLMRVICNVSRQTEGTLVERCASSWRNRIFACWEVPPENKSGEPLDAHFSSIWKKPYFS
jgi:hypothetical protein